MKFFPKARATTVSMLTVLWISLIAYTAAADDLPDGPPRLPGERTFEQLENRLTDIRKSRFADAVEKEINDADRLIRQGRLWVLAGRLKKAGRAADLLEATLLLASLKIRIAEKKENVEKALLRNARLENDLSSLQKRIDEIMDERRNRTRFNGGKEPVPEDTVSSEGNIP